MATLSRGPARGDLVVALTLVGIIGAIRRFVGGNEPEYPAADIAASALGLRESREGMTRLKDAVDSGHEGNIWTIMLTGGGSNRTVNPARKRTGPS